MTLFATWRHVRRLTDVEDRLREVEARVKALDLEWNDTHDQLQRMLGKISKRTKALEKAEEGQQQAPAEAEDPALAAVAGTGKFGSKTGIILRQIAARRGG